MLDLIFQESRQAELRELAGEQAVAQLKVQLDTRQRLHDQVRSQYSLQQRAMQEADFELECTKLRVETLEASLSRAKENLATFQNKMAVLTALEDALEKKGVPIQSLSPESQSERIVALVENLSKHELFTSVRSALSDVEASIEPFLEQLHEGKDPQDILDEMIGDGTLSKIVLTLAESGMFGPKIKGMGQNGRLGTFLDSICSMESRGLIGRVTQTAITVATTPANQRVEVLSSNEVSSVLSEITQSGVFGSSIQGIIASGKVGPMLLRLASMGKSGGAGSGGAKMVELGTKIVNNTALRGSILMLAQMSGDAAIVDAASTVTEFLDTMQGVITELKPGDGPATTNGAEAAAATTVAETNMAADGTVETTMAADGTVESTKAAEAIVEAPTVIDVASPLEVTHIAGTPERASTTPDITASPLGQSTRATTVTPAPATTAPPAADVAPILDDAKPPAASVHTTAAMPLFNPGLFLDEDGEPIRVLNKIQEEGEGNDNVGDEEARQVKTASGNGQCSTNENEQADYLMASPVPAAVSGTMQPPGMLN